MKLGKAAGSAPARHLGPTRKGIMQEGVTTKGAVGVNSFPGPPLPRALIWRLTTCYREGFF